MEINEKKDDYVDYKKESWYIKSKSQLQPGKYLKIYRENFSYTQKKLGSLIGNFSAQNVSEMERSKRGISKDVAKSLSNIFKVDIKYFL